jgi:DNA-binding response OmpR family regulator
MLKAGRGKMNQLLIVDDEPAVARLIERIAKSCGYEVAVTHGAEDFMDALVATEPDAIVLDLSLPQVDGVELLRFLAATKCRAKILIISGFDARVLETSGRLGEARGLKICGTLMKPVRAGDLRAALAALGAPVPA